MWLLRRREERAKPPHPQIFMQQPRTIVPSPRSSEDTHCEGPDSFMRSMWLRSSFLLLKLATFVGDPTEDPQTVTSEPDHDLTLSDLDAVMDEP